MIPHLDNSCFGEALQEAVCPEVSDYGGLLLGVLGAEGPLPVRDHVGLAGLGATDAFRQRLGAGG